MKKIALLPLVLALTLGACDRPASSPPPVPPPTSVYAHVDELLKKKDVDAAVEELEALRAERGPEPALVLRLGRALIAQDNPSRAATRYKECLVEHPDAAAVHAALGEVYQRLGQNAPARDSFEKARAAGHEDPALALSLGTCLGQLGDLAGAEREFELARAGGVEDKFVDFNIALLLTQQKKGEEAKAKLEKIVAADPQWAVAKRELARVLLGLYPSDPTQVDRALNLAMDAREGLTDDWRLFEVLGDGFLLTGDYEASVAMYTDALRLGLNPKQVEEKYVVAKKKLLEAQKPALAPSSTGQPQ